MTWAMGDPPCPHRRTVESYDENDDRIRAFETCTVCDKTWHRCKAKRLDDEGRDAWGPPGEWWHSVVR